MPLGIAPGIVELAGHAVEGLGQHAQFVAAVNGLARREVTSGDGLRPFGRMYSGATRRRAIR